MDNFICFKNWVLEAKNEKTMIFYPLTVKESKKDILTYDFDNFVYKLVHTDLDKLKDFLKKHFKNNYYKKFYYIEIPSIEFEIANKIESEEGTLIIKIPFSINISNYKLNKFK